MCVSGIWGGVHWWRLIYTLQRQLWLQVASVGSLHFSRIPYTIFGTYLFDWGEALVTAHMRRSKDNLGELVLSLHRVSSKNWTRSSGLAASASIHQATLPTLLTNLPSFFRPLLLSFLASLLLSFFKTDPHYVNLTGRELAVFTRLASNSETVLYLSPKPIWNF